MTIEVLVMGGTEFVSSSIAKHLISKGYEVDIFTRGKKDLNYDGVRNHIKGDRRSGSSLKDKLNDKHYNVVFDISAYTKKDIQLLTSVLNRNKLKNYIFCSSIAVYKYTKEIIKENYPRGFNQDWGDYGLNKKQAEDYLFNLYKKENFPITIFRPAYIYGEGNNIYREAYFFDRIKNNLAIPIPIGNSKNQFIHIKDLVKVFASVIHSDKTIGNAYNLANSQKVSWNYLLETCMKVVGKNIEIKKIDYRNLSVAVRSFFPFNDIEYLLSMEKLERDGLYIPKIKLTEGLEKAYKWYSAEEVNLEDIKMNKIGFVLNR
ncbi:SDR family oxidoreductase [Natroniella sp. ANB-PHB2]|uniref:SDR family oxidoreductase n=1 Tax=Natroniella sp. ANB-PHB2 TaxID=3384444 RepID=UPI0038D3FD94